ncbi:phosphoglycerate mutase-like protein [Epithele typhae]|uniref:phosphoglycerate mutase-like protein n=1 Tax=Epithele typhae TaxID=378194 RepID=UPI002007F5B6|nr:phosphoglycerate mutase-like protein [Epithele typhae]KAH9945810.1 phosphoglycerate mutase-like protein [Epithele typhae]
MSLVLSQQSDAAPVVRVYVVRHGETDANLRGIVQGHLDTALNATGVAQARLAADALADVPFSAAYCSDLQRARKTAQIILGDHPDVELQECSALRERFMGDWQGEFISERGDAPTNLEPTAEFVARATRWWNDTIGRHAQRAAALRSRRPAAQSDEDEDEPVHVLVVSHGGLIGTLATALLGSRKVRAGRGVLVGRCFNASISVFELNGRGKGALVSYADTTHLDGELVQDNADVQP